jgi:hypothetical protein
MKLSIPTILMLLCAPFPALGYEQATHALITKLSAALSSADDATVGPESLLTRLGLNVISPTGTGDSYFEFADQINKVVAFPREAQQFEKKILDNLK